MNLILDLDGTLISEDEARPLPRPHLHEFLEWAFRRFQRVSVWSAAQPEWVTARLEQAGMAAFPFHFVWANVAVSRRVVRDRLVVRKRLRKVCKKWPNFYTLHNTLVVDNTPETFAENHGNGVLVPTFWGEANDRVLLDLMAAVPGWEQRFAEVNSVRCIPKVL